MNREENWQGSSHDSAGGGANLQARKNSTGQKPDLLHDIIEST